MATYITKFFTTEAGTRVLADAVQANQPLKFVRGQIGTGTPTGGDAGVGALTALVAPKYDMEVQAVGPNVSFPPATFGMDLIIASDRVAETTQMTEIGLFAQVGNDTNTETLFAYGYSTTPEELLAGSELVYQSHRLIDTLVSTTSDISVTVESIVNPNITVNHIQDVDGNITLLAKDIPTTDSDVQTELDNIKSKDINQDTSITNINSKNSQQDDRLDALEAKDNQQDGRLDNIEDKNTSQDSEISKINNILSGFKGGEVLASKVLWSGDIWDGGATLTLNESIANYDNVTVYYRVGSSYGSSQYSSSSTFFGISGVNTQDTLDGTVVMKTNLTETHLTKVSNTQFKINFIHIANTTMYNNDDGTGNMRWERVVYDESTGVDTLSNFTLSNPSTINTQSPPDHSTYDDNSFHILKIEGTTSVTITI